MSPAAPARARGTRRSPQYPEVPTAIEEGMPGFHSTAWHAVVAPAGTPRSVILNLQQTFTAAVASPELRRIMAVDDVELVGSSPAELAKFLRTENDKWGKVIRSAGIKID